MYVKQIGKYSTTRNPTKGGKPIRLITTISTSTTKQDKLRI